MPQTINYSFHPATTLTLLQLADLYTRTFADYFYEAIITPALMAHFVRIDHLSLAHSPLLRADGDWVGLATLGVRGAEAYCKGFGIVPSHRGRGLARALCAEVIAQARLAGARRLTLGVLQRNERAVQTYLHAGLRVRRELLSFEWNGNDGRPQTVDGSWPSVASADSKYLLRHFAALHPVPPIWERDLPTLSMLDALHGLAITNGDTLLAYVLYVCSGDDHIEVVDIAGAGAQHAAPLLRSLQQQYAHITCSNETADSPMIVAFRAAGFTETWPRYEMEMEL